MTQLPNTPPTKGFEALEAFVFNPDQFHTEDIPLGLDPLVVVKFIQLRVNRLTPVRALLQVLKVADFYDAHECCDHLIKLLDQKEQAAEELMRSSIITRIVAIIGEPPHRDAAKTYYSHLVNRTTQLPVLEQLILVFDALSTEADPKPLAAKLDNRAAALRPQADAVSRRELQAVEKSINQLTRAQRAGAIKAKILGIADRNARIDEEVRTYLALQHGFGEFLPIWAARRLRRETWAQQPAQQTTRKVDPQLRNDVVAALRRVLPSIDKAAQLTASERNFMKVTAMHAIGYFGGTLAEEEQKFLDETGKDQKSYLRPA